jgi:hypothetical protein
MLYVCGIAFLITNKWFSAPGIFNATNKGIYSFSLPPR